MADFSVLVRCSTNVTQDDISEIRWYFEDPRIGGKLVPNGIKFIEDGLFAMDFADETCCKRILNNTKHLVMIRNSKIEMNVSRNATQATSPKNILRKLSQKSLLQSSPILTNESGDWNQEVISESLTCDPLITSATEDLTEVEEKNMAMKLAEDDGEANASLEPLMTEEHRLCVACSPRGTRRPMTSEDDESKEGTKKIKIEWGATINVEPVLDNEKTFTGSSIYQSMTPAVPLSPRSRDRTIQVLDVPYDDFDLLELYLENEKMGGGEVDTFSHNIDEHFSIVTFADVKVAAYFLSLGSIILNGNTLMISHIPEVEPKKEQMEVGETEFMSDVKPVAVNSIEVIGIKPKLTEDMLKLYFENKKRSGGGLITNVEIFPEEERAVITFQETEVARRVLEQPEHVLRGSHLECRAVNNLVNAFHSFAIEVSGFSNSISEEMLLMFFENRRRSGGGVVDEIYFKADEHRAVITYTDSNTVERVLQNHRSSVLLLNNVRLSVSVLRPTLASSEVIGEDIEQDKLLIRNFPLDASLEHLQRYFSRGSGSNITEVKYSSEPGVTLVYFKDPYVFIHLKKLVCTKPLLDRMLSIEKVPIPSSIQVFNVGQLTLDHLTLYFESSKAGGEEVIDSYINTEDGYAVLQFADKNVLCTVLSREHEIEGNKLFVSVYYKGLGIVPPGADVSRPNWFLPGSLLLNCDHRKLSFIKNCTKLQRKIERVLETVYCKIDWPSVTESEDTNVKYCLTLHCTLTQKMENFSQLAKNWAVTCRNKMSQELDDIVAEDVGILQELWRTVFERVELLNEKVCSDEASVLFDEDAYMIRIAGAKIHCEKFVICLKKLVADAEMELQQEKRKVAETCTKLKCHQRELLKLIGFLESDEDVSVTVTDTEVSLYGLSGQITTKKIKMYEILSGIISELVEIPDFVLESLKQRLFRNHICQCLKQKGIMAVWDLGSKGLTVYALNQDEIDKTASIIKSEVIHTTIELDSAEAAVIKLHEWTLKKQSLKQNFEICNFSEQSSCIIVITTRDKANAVLEIITNFVKEYAVKEKVLKLKHGPFTIVNQYLKAELQDICNAYPRCHVSIKENPNPNSNWSGFVISGTVHGLDSAMKTVLEISNRVIVVEKILDRPGISNYLHSTRGKQQLELLSNRHKVFIEESAEMDKSKSKSSYINVDLTEDPQVLTNVKIAGSSFFVKIVLGDITVYKVDAIINAANGQLNHIGGVARHIVDKGGASIQTECSNFIKANGELLSGHLFVSKPGNLPCQHIIHAVGPIWQKGEKNEENTLFDTIYSILEKAENLKLKRIAMPAISTGVYGFPLNKAARIILEAISEFVEKESIYYLKEVHIIDTNRRVTKQFVDILPVVLNGNKDEPIVIDDDQDSSSGHAYRNHSTGQKSSYSLGAQSSQSPQQHASSPSSSFSRTASSSSSSQLTGSSVSGNILTTSQGLQVILIKGSIVQQIVDVIVNTTTSNLILNHGAVSSQILQHAGPSIQLECQQKAPNGVGIGQIAVTAGYSLPCKFVYHGSCLAWDNGVGQCEQSVRSLLKTVFNEAHKNGMNSLAIPAIGTGNLRIPHALVAKVMYEEVEAFSRSCSITSLNKVHFVVYDKDQPTLSAFENELHFPSRGVKQKAKKSSERVLAKSKSTSDASSKVQGGLGGWSISINGVKLEVSQGDITQAQTEAIVNSASETLNLKLGDVSNAILQAGGQQIQNECLKIGKMTNGMAVTSAGNLPSKFIFHLKAHSTERGWRQGIENCLVEAEQRQIKSITFPLLGTGNKRAPVQTMAVLMLDAVANFSIKTSPQHLTHISINIFQPPMLEEFAKAIDSKAREHQSTGFFDRVKVYFKSILGISENPSKTKLNSFDVQEIAQEKSWKYNERVRFRIYGLMQEAIKSAADEMDDICSDVIQDKVVETDIIAKLSDEQIARIENLQQEHPVKITVEKGHRINRIRLQGEGHALVSVQDCLYAIFGEVQEMEREEYQAEIIAKQAQWMYQCDESYDPYPKAINLIIENSYQARSPFAEWEEDDGVYRLDFHRMEESKNGDGKNIVRVKRMTSESSIPKSWDMMNSDELCKRVILSPNSQEYQDVLQNVNNSAGGTVKQIISIERIQNPSLYQQYIVRREAMERLQQGSNYQCERILWHGTSSDTVESINLHGFNRSYCGKNAVAYGKGVYFAQHFSYSGSATYAVPDASGVKHVYQSRVLTGEFIDGRQSYFVAPLKPGSTAVRYDSVVDNPAAPSIFVIFSDTQAYPEYLVVFK